MSGISDGVYFGIATLVIVLVAIAVCLIREPRDE